MSTTTRRRGRIIATAAAAVLVAAGAGTIAVGVWGNPPPPAPPAAAASSTPTVPAPPKTSDAPQPTPEAPATHGPILSASTPTHLTIPAIGVDTSLIDLGLNKDGTVQVPSLATTAPAGWFTGSPSPGQLGPSVILGHVDSTNGRSVFYRLGDIRPDDTVKVARHDGTTAVFTVDRIEDYPKDDFPTMKVYGNTDRAALRLITCGGTWNPSIGHYDHNVVVYAHLTSTSDGS